MIRIEDISPDRYFFVPTGPSIYYVTFTPTEIIPPIYTEKELDDYFREFPYV